MNEHILKTSLDKGEPITIIYLKDNVITRRNIKVLEIRESEVLAFCYMRHQPRLFKKENILAMDFSIRRVY